MTSYIHQKIFGKTAVSEVLKNYHENVFSVALIEQIKLSNMPPLTIVQMFSASVTGIFKIAWRASDGKSLFKKVIGEQLFAFYNSVKNSVSFH